MFKLIIKRLGLMIPLLIIISMVVFALAIIQPGDPFSGQYGTNIKQEALDAQREKLGLNDSIPQQYIRWANNIIHGDFGESIKYKRPVMDLIKERLPNTILLGSVSLIITYIISFTLGIVSGRYAYTISDYSIQVFNYIMLAIPSFIAGVFAIFFFAFQLNLFPFQGSVDINVQEGTFSYY
ncbi:ABC transporter permease, partial [Staphylococcus aureus]|nr:ABC transporter permease [Staphylococcus aureus]